MLTPRQIKERSIAAFSFIEKFWAENECSPTIREIGGHLGIKSTARVFALVNDLKNIGLIAKSSKRHRSIKIKRRPDASN